MRLTRLLVLSGCSLLVLLYCFYIWREGLGWQQRILADCTVRVWTNPVNATDWVDHACRIGMNDAERELKFAIALDRDCADAYKMLARMNFNRPDLNNADEYYKVALNLREKVPGDHNVELVAILDEIALVDALQGRNHAAEKKYARALASLESAVGPYDLTLAGFMLRVGDFYGLQRNYAQAERLYRRALAIQVSAESANSDIAISRPPLPVFDGSGRYPCNLKDGLHKMYWVLKSTGRNTAAAKFRSLEERIDEYIHNRPAWVLAREREHSIGDDIVKAIAEVEPLKNTDKRTFVSIQSLNLPMVEQNQEYWFAPPELEHLPE